jgi:hypothetical protein
MNCCPNRSAANTGVKKANRIIVGQNNKSKKKLLNPEVSSEQFFLSFF